MADVPKFHELMARVRAGDAGAAESLVRHYEGIVRRAIRFRLVDSRLRTAFDSLDICQAVLGSFFVRAAAGQYELDQPEQLRRLLVTMARNKLATWARKENAECRDRRRLKGAGPELQEFANPRDAPSRAVAASELLAEARRRFSPEELQLIDLRQQGRDWEAIALELGEDARTLRKRHSRALNRVARELDLDDSEDE
jgi:RNA polymerase sigma-70 factor (ECF subfamily)